MAAEIPISVIRKLTFFTAAMVIAPLLVFFISQNLFHSSSIVSGGLAALTANIVLIGYVVVAFTEDIPKSDATSNKKTD
ncbi:Piso0_005851 [Millerozyma farinosa CBS 7064]|uniref:Piso0_005851 protein n=1 Tax=Pichia sorbitophila (strain ATCC MYA-4447 / BCRC 22081 / CBS 7064 / NBRC 10061 / NRRL Y-12695) TaxID=559304 RepID=G8Y334_PICSO|nr:Piso0_005851 [Millerozyma farinosa CBS 7064]